MNFCVQTETGQGNNNKYSIEINIVQKQNNKRQKWHLMLMFKFG